FLIKPEINGRLYYAKASLKSAMGLIESYWRRQDDNLLTLEITVPFDATAEARLPHGRLETIHGLGDLEARQVGDAVAVCLPAGRYSFTYRATCSFDLKYSLDTPLAELLAIPETRALLAQELPQLLEMAKGEMNHLLPYSLGETSRTTDPSLVRMMLGDADLNDLEQKLAAIPVKAREKAVDNRIADPIDY
ncbi:MAG: hypothetical protein GX276_06035, partial [Clostridiaceae bacterium]|nr:hypothetical protein [Clostridiaceae bacterium]